MADNTQLSTGSGGDVIKTEDVGPYKLAVSKIYLGAHGIDGGAVTPSNPLPVSVGNFPAVHTVTGSVSVGNFPGSQAVTAAALPLPAGASTEVTLAAMNAKLGSLGQKAMVGSTPIVIASDQSPIPVTVGNLPAVQPVSGSIGVSNFPATQPISGTVTASVPGGIGLLAGTNAIGSVTVGNFPATQPVSGTVSVGGTALTDLIDRSARVLGSATVSGTVNVGNLPATQPISGAVSVSGSLPAGTNAIGSVTVGNFPASQITDMSDRSARVLGSATVSGTVGLAAGTQMIGVAISPQQTGAIYSGTTGLTPKFAAISAAISGDNTVVAAVVGKKIRVLKYTIVTSGAVAAKFRSSSGVDLTGGMSLSANSGVGGAFCPVGLFETISGDGLALNLSGAVAVAGHLTYIEV
ncbi:MAG: hypothetical protein JWN86_2028 [Planctomycetota bacterium]|nr:hypothetical protein [Planctomycetota bacterium]